MRDREIKRYIDRSVRKAIRHELTRHRDDDENKLFVKIKAILKRLDRALTNLIQSNAIVTGMVEMVFGLRAFINTWNAGVNTLKVANALLTRMNLLESLCRKHGLAKSIYYSAVLVCITIVKPLLKAYIDKKIILEIERRKNIDLKKQKKQKDSSFKDFGVKGMKKGVRHEDPKSGNVRRARSGNAPQAQQKSAKWKKAAIAGGAALGAIGLGLLAKKKLGSKTGTSLVRNAASQNRVPTSVTKLSSPGTSLVKSSSSSHSNLGNTEWVKKALKDPNHVWDI